jgi:hypothetical protein
LKGIQDIVFVSMGHDCANYNMFQDFTTYTCKRYGSIVFRRILRPFLVNGCDIQ